MTLVGWAHYQEVGSQINASAGIPIDLAPVSRAREHSIKPSSGVSAKLPEDLVKRGLFASEPCEKCGCPISRYLVNDQVCVRCYPPRGYHTYNDQVDLLYPRKRGVAF